ncbi:TetR-like C-terminal domain-containing protein [Nocardia concava]|uniref:TetR-like C-terminal domain-containing protein n=1 Tax=Nocardia concava TaxID=257281 RepID=UPI000300098E|nr:TetR-like C-terminal domain-containing protein [Nocardia concava]
MSTPRQGPGRPREDRIDHSALAATRNLLARGGYAALTVDAVAAAAGVSKAAIYRRFGSKAEMAFRAAIHDTALPTPIDTGSLRSDLLELAHKIRESMGNPLAREAGPALIAELAKDAALAESFRESALGVEIDYIRDILEKAVTRGELTELPDPAEVHLLMAGPVFYSLFGFQKEVGADSSERLAEVVAAGLLAGR